MSTLKGALTRRAVKSTARHSAHGTASKLKRRPLRTATLLALGAGIGAAVTGASGAWFRARGAG